MSLAGNYGRSPKNTTTTKGRIYMTTRKTTKSTPEDIAIAFAFTEYSAHRLRIEGERRKRDRDLATSVGIEIGVQREADRRKARIHCRRLRRPRVHPDWLVFGEPR